MAADEKKPEPGSDMNLETFPDLDEAPGKPRLLAMTKEQIAEAKARAQRAGSAK